MTPRIQALLQRTMCGKMYPTPRITEFDRRDRLLPKRRREVKQLCQYIMNQEPVLTEHSKMTGAFRCHSSVVGDAFHRGGHRAFQDLLKDFYLQGDIINRTVQK